MGPFRRGSATLAALVLVSSAGLVTTPSYGQPEVRETATDERSRASNSEAVSVGYTAPAANESCPSKEQFLDNVRRYTVRFRVVPPSTNLRNFRIRLETSRGELVVDDPSGKGSRRDIVASDCERIARGLAIAMALAIDPEADVFGARPPGSVVEPPGPTAIDTPRPSSPGVRDEQPAPAEATSTVNVADEKSPPPERPSQRRLQLAFQGRFELTSLLARSTAPVFGAVVEGRVRSADAAGWLEPSLAVGLRQSWPISLSAPDGDTSLSWTAALLRLCPIRLPLPVAGLDVAPCVEGNGGVLRAGLPGKPQVSTGWFDLGGSLQAVYRLGKGWGVGGAALVSTPFIRHRFAVVRGAVLSQAPAVGVTAGIFLEFRL